MNIRNWKRAGVGACTAAALVVGAGLAFGPAANATTGPLSGATDLVNGTTTSATTAVNGLLAGATSGSSTPITTTGGGVSVPLGGSSLDVTTNDGLGVGVGVGGSQLVGVQLGGSTGTATGTVSGTVTGGVSGGTGGTGGTGGAGGAGPSDGSGGTGGTGGTGGSGGSGGSTPAAPVILTALSVVSQYSTVYPAKDGYRDSTTFTLNGTTSDGQQHAASGLLTLKFGSSVVTTWPITATNQVISWNGLKGGKIVPGSYTVTATIGDADGHQVSATDRVVVSPKKLASTTQLFTSKSVSGSHRMASQPKEGLKHGKVTVRITSVASNVKGKQYLVFTHGSKKLKIRILNGKHTSKAVTIPKSFTTYTISHTWKNGTVKIRSLKYKYSFKALK